MKDISRSLLTSFIGGFLVLLPLILTCLMLGQLFDALMALTVPIAELLPKSAFSDIWVHRLVAIGVLLGLCLLVGKAADTRAGKEMPKTPGASISIVTESSDH